MRKKIKPLRKLTLWLGLIGAMLFLLDGLLLFFNTDLGNGYRLFYTILLIVGACYNRKEVFSDWKWFG